jgi:hypothetical protein
MTKKKLPHGSILHALYDARQAGRRMIDLYDIEVSLGISGWDLRAAVEDLKTQGLCIENEDGIMISDAGFNEAQSRWA